MSGVLVVIPCLDEERHLPRLLGQLLPEAPSDATIVVADGGSRDASRPIIEAFARQDHRVHLLDNPARIQSAGINLAVRRFGAGHRWLVRIDAHCGYPPAYIDGLLDAARSSRATSVVVPMVTVGKGCQQASAAAAQNSVLGNGGSAHRRMTQGAFVDHGHHALMDLALYRAAGGYDESFSHNEDAELDRRLLRAGGTIWLEPSLPLTYWPRATLRALFRQYRGYGRGRAMTLMRHRCRLRLRQVIPLAVAPMVSVGMLAAGLALVAAVLDSGAAPVLALLALPALGYAALCIGYGAMLAVRSGVRCVTGPGVAAMTMHFAWSLGFIERAVTMARPGPEPAPIPVDFPAAEVAISQPRQGRPLGT